MLPEDALGQPSDKAAREGGVTTLVEQRPRLFAVSAEKIGRRSADAGRNDADAGHRNADAALRVLYDDYWASMVRLATLLLGSSDTAEEVVQEALIGIYRRLGRFAESADAAGYLRSSVVNGCRSVHRHRKVTIKYRQPAPPEPPGPSEIAERRESDARVMAALRQLPRRQQEVLVLRYYSDASEAEIAATLGISRGAVKSHSHRGITALRAALSDHDGPEHHDGLIT